VYGEVRYCPSLHRQQGLDDDSIVAAVAAGLVQAMAENPQCSFNQILTCLRDLEVEEAMVIVQLGGWVGGWVRQRQRE
jgi:adenosine deaminase